MEEYLPAFSYVKQADPKGLGAECSEDRGVPGVFLLRSVPCFLPAGTTSWVPFWGMTMDGECCLVQGYGAVRLGR